MNTFKHLKRKALVVSLLAASSTAFAGGFAYVSNGSDSGKGSLRHALEVKEANIIVIDRRVSDIVIDSTLEYSSKKPVTIWGSGQTVKLDTNADILAITEGANLTVANVDFEGQPGKFSISNRGDQGETAGKGIFIDVRDDQTGTVSLKLSNVKVSGVANHGIHVSDCSLSDDCGAGSGGEGDGSPASISVIFNNVTIDDAGNGKFDADGLRVDDRGEGDIYFFARNSLFTHVGADGVELDEGDNGSVLIDVAGSSFVDNGGYCDPELLGAYESDGEYDEGEVQESDVPALPSGTLDDTCFEREVSLYDDGSVEEYEIVLDLDDGIDLDEAGEGGLVTKMVDSTITGNLDEGVDFDEEGPGSIYAKFIRSAAQDNTDDGFKLSEEDEGDVKVVVRKSISLDNGGEGFTLEEADEGNLNAKVVRTTSLGNKKKDADQFEAVQEDEGQGTLRVINSDITGYTLEGVEQI